MKALIAIILSSLLALPASAAQSVHDQVAKLKLGQGMTAQMKDGRELHGTLMTADNNGFTLSEVDLKTNVTARYDDTVKVTEDYGRKGFQGKRVNPHRARWIGLAVIGGLLTLAFVAVATDKS